MAKQTFIHPIDSLTGKLTSSKTAETILVNRRKQFGKTPKGETITLDFDLDEYISKNTTPRAESVAQFYVEVDAFGYR